MQNKTIKKITGVKFGVPKIWLNTRGDCWETCWAEDDCLYTVADDTRGIGDPETDRQRQGSNLALNVFRGSSLDDVQGETINHMLDYGEQNAQVPEGCSDGCCWKAMGITSVDDVLYMSVGRHDYGGNNEDLLNRQTAQNASIIKSTDRGKTWTRPADINYQNPMFMGGKFGTPYFIHYGKAGQETVHNSDKYVYAVSNNGYWDNGDTMKLGRVLRSKIGELNAADWEYYKGGDGMDNAAWSKSINDVMGWMTDNPGHILFAPGKCSMTGACYIEGLERYVMIQWYYTSGSGQNFGVSMSLGLPEYYTSESGQNFRGSMNLGLPDPGHETVWDFYESPFPWGPWTKFHSHTWNPTGMYCPCIIPKFCSSDGSKIAIFTNGNFQSTLKEGADCTYRLITLECELVLQ